MMERTNNKEKRKRSVSGRVARVAMWVVVGIVGLVVLLTLLIAPVGKAVINRHGEDFVGRKIEVDKLLVNVYTGHLRVGGLRLYEDDGQQVFVSFDTLDVKARLMQLLNHAVDLRRIHLSGLHVNVLQYDSTFNFTSLIDHFASTDTTVEEDTVASKPWAMRFKDIRLRHARLSYRDVPLAKQWDVADLNFHMPGFELGGTERSKAGLNLALSQGGRLSVGADFNSTTNDFAVNAHLQDFNMQSVKEYLTGVVALQDMAGQLDVNVTVRGKLDEVGKSVVKGTVQLSDFALVDSSNVQVVGLAKLLVDIDKIDLENNQYDVSQLTVDGLAARYEQWNNGSNIDRLLRPMQSAPTEAAVEEPMPADTVVGKEESSPMQLHVGNVAVVNSSVQYIDHTLPELFDFSLTKIDVKSENITLNGDNKASIKAALPGGGHLMVKWNGNIDNWKQHQDLFITVKGLNMTQLSPWALEYTAQPITDGVFSLTSRNRINKSVIGGENKIDIYRASMGSRNKEIDAPVKLPLKTALYILKDKDEKILIDVPVKGNIDNPEFSYMKIVWKTLGNLIVKVASSPARAIGNAIGAGGEDLEFLAIDPSQHGLTSEQYHTLNTLTSILKSDTLLSISLVQQMPLAENDSVAMRYERLNHMVKAYMIEQGADTNRLHVLRGAEEMPSKTGYEINSEINIE